MNAYAPETPAAPHLRSWGAASSLAKVLCTRGQSGFSGLKQIAVALTFFAVSAAQAQVSVQDPWVKGAGQGQMATAAYMTLKATQAVRITGAESPVAGIVEIHQMSMGPNDTMTMRAVPQIDIAAGQSVELKPGGLHIMLMDLAQTPIKPGQTVPITLLLQTADGRAVKQSVKASVRPLTATHHGSGGAAKPSP